MGTRSLSLNSDNSPRRRRSFTLSFRKTTGEQQSVDTRAPAAEETARIKKAAAWQWFTRGLSDVVLPTKRPTAVDTPTSAAAEDVGDKLGSRSASEANRIEKKPGSRFKAEASSRDRPPAGPPPATRASRAAPSPLYDEVELSGLKTQMADFVQRLQQKQSHQKVTAKPARAPDAPTQPPPLRPPPAAEPTIRRPIPFSAEVTVSGFRRPISAVHRFFRKVLSGSAYKSDSATATVQGECQVIPPEEAVNADDTQNHYHHYIHYHHHHYHYGAPSPEEAEFTPRHRRHSESSGFRPGIPALIWEENELDEDDVEGSPISVFLARRRRHSDSSFAEAVRNFTKKADTNKMDRKPFEEPVKLSPKMLHLPRRYNSERFTDEIKAPRKEEHWAEVPNGMWPSADVKSRRRHSTESIREGERMENARWSLGVPIGGGGAAGGGVYKLSGGNAGYEGRPVVGRRHSEGFDTLRRRAEGAVHEEQLMYRGNGYHDNEEREGLKRGGAAGGGVYKPSGGEAGYEDRAVRGRRHSESFDMRRRRAGEDVYDELFTYGGNGYHDQEERGGLKGRWLRTPSPASMRLGEGPRLPAQAATNARQRRSPLPPIYPVSYHL